jgi:hypothetical protein
MRIKGGMQVGPDGRIHTTFGHNPSSLRLCSFDPNLQNIPRGGKGTDNWVKEFFVAPAGHTFWERDFSGIEARLVGWFSGSSRYTYITGIDVHSFYTAYALNALDGRITANDLPDLEWPEEKLRARLRDIKAAFKSERNNLYKHLVHGANYLQTPNGAQKHIFKVTGIAYDIKIIRKVMGVYFELFPEISTWHRELAERVDGTKKRHAEDDLGAGIPDDRIDPWSLGVCYARNPFGYVHHFYNVLDWEKIDGKWYSTFGEDAKRLVSFLPQSTAAAIIKQAAKRLYYEHPAIGETLRLLIHDSILGETREGDLEQCLRVSKEVMESPIRELPLDPTWGMGEFLVIGSEAKVGRSWGDMKEYE